jgi:hypothetical protein
MASSYRLSVEPELSLQSGPSILDRGGVSNALGLVSAAPSDSMPSRGVISARSQIGVLLYLVSVVLVGAATVGLFFGSAFVLLAQPKQQMYAESGTRDHDPEADPLRSTEPSAGAQNAVPSGGGVPMLSSANSEATISAPTQTATSGESSPSSRAASVQALSVTPGEAAVIVPQQTATPGEPASISRAASVPPPRSRANDRFPKLLRPPRLRIDTIPGEARAAGGRTRLARQDRKHDLQEYPAGSANQQEYDQLHATGPTVSLPSLAPSR